MQDDVIFSFINIVAVILSCCILHGLAHRVSSRLLQVFPAPLPPDRPILFIFLFILFLVLDFHFLEVMAYLTGVNLVHVLFFLVVLFVSWMIIAKLFQEPYYPVINVGIRLSSKQMYGRICSFIPEGKIERVCLAVGGIVWSVFFLEGVTRPPDGWDGLVYHLPLAVKWMQNGNLHFIPESWKFNMPGNGELIVLFLMYLGEERVLSISYVPILLLGVIVVYAMALRIGASSSSSFLAAIGFGTVPIILNNAFTTYIDLFGSVFFLLSLYFVLWWAQVPGRVAGKVSNLFITMIGLSFGIALGAKYIYFPLTILIVVLVFMVSVKVSRVSLSRLKCIEFSGWNVALALVSGLLPSILWYIRNYQYIGYPFYPMQFVFVDGGLKIKRAMMVEKWEWLPSNKFDTLCPYVLTSFKKIDLSNAHEIIQTFWFDCHYSGDHYGPNSGLGPVFTAFVLTSLFFALGYVLYSFVSVRVVLPVIYPIAVSLAVIVFWWYFLFHALRFLLPVVALLCAVFAYSLSLLRGNPRHVALCVLLGTFLLNGALVSARPIQKIASRIHHNEWSRSGYYDMPHVIDSLPRGSVVLNAGHELKNYPLYGEGHTNYVVTNRVLIEPQQLRQITRKLLDQWKVEYIYFESNSNVVFAEDVRLTVVHESNIENAYGKFQQIFYKVN